MTTELRTMLLEANPVPHNEYFEGSDELAAIFSTIQRRTSMVKQDERRPDVVPIGTEPPRRRRTALVIAAAAFAVVIVVVGGIAVLTDDGPETTIPPVTTEATTTTEAPTTTAEVPVTPAPEPTPVTTPPITDAEQEIIDGMVDAFNSEDIDTFVSYLSPDTRVEWATFPIAESPYSTWGNDLVNDLRRRAATDLRATGVECERATVSIRCSAVMVGSLWGTVVPVDATFHFEFAEEQLTRFRFLPVSSQVAANADAFGRWHNETYPDEPNVLDELLITDEVAALLGQRVEEYRDFLWRSALEPEQLEAIDGALRAYSDGDVDALMALLAPGAELREGPETRPNDLLNPETFRTRAEFAASIGEHFEVRECRSSAPVVTCDVAMSDDFTRALGLEPFVGSIAFEVTDGAITLWRVDESSASSLENRVALVGFERWHQTTYPDDPMLHWPSESAYYYWTRNAANVDITARRIAEYLATLEG